jgi:hypothetical protein
MNIVSSSGLSLSIKNLSFQVTDLFSGHAFCNGFDSLIVGGMLSLSFEEVNELLPAPLFVDIVKALDSAAQSAADDDLANELEARNDYRIACHG